MAYCDFELKMSSIKYVAAREKRLVVSGPKTSNQTSFTAVFVTTAALSLGLYKTLLVP